MANHTGFKVVEKSISKKEGVSEKAAGAILASSSRSASKGAKEKNPRLKKVKGSSHSHREKMKSKLHEMFGKKSSEEREENY